ncbi:MAG: hypothetical protein JSV52_05245 [Candidatus Zixiibacteriota bacterium]|nr:MAG: hypothetical protein JSV52_05245 [candidate division Zixibacteria bacterium]
MREITLTILFSVLLFMMSSCGSVYRNDTSESAIEAGFTGEIQVEAYLFDAKLRRDTKPTSVRLEFYHTDSVIAIAGRGYLGKGALRGRLSADTLQVYFPTTDEYVYESVATVLSSVKCSGQLPSINLLALFNSLPDSVLSTSNLIVESDYSNQSRPEFRIMSENCLWEMRLKYSVEEEGWRIKEFEFDDGEGNTLKGKRRTYKRQAEVKASKFYVPIKPGSQRIIL